MVGLAFLEVLIVGSMGNAADARSTIEKYWAVEEFPPRLWRLSCV